MASLDGILTRKALAQSASTNVNANQPVALRIYNKGKKAVTSVTTVTATSLRLIDADGDSGALNFSVYTTLGALADKVNSLTNWECVVLDALRSDVINTGNVLASAALTSPSCTVDGYSFWDVMVDTNVALSITVRAMLDRKTPSLARDSYDRRMRIQEIDYFATLGGAAADGLQVWEVKGGNETQVFSKLPVSGTLTQLYILNGGVLLDSGYGCDLVVRVKDGASLSDTGATLQIDFIKE